MNFRWETDEEDDDETVNCNPPPLRQTAFSKPLLPSSASLLPGRIRASGSAVGGARNGIGFERRPEGARHASQDPSPAAGGGDSSSPPVAMYRKCLRNHAASLSGHVLDGCGEFMPASTDALKCAACGCHRSFHRRKGESDNLFYLHHHHNGGTPSGCGSNSDVARNPLLLPPPSHPALQKKHIHSFQASPAALVAFDKGHQQLRRHHDGIIQRGYRPRGHPCGGRKRA